MRDFRDMAIGGLGLSGHHVRDAGRDLHRPQMADSRQPSHRFRELPEHRCPSGGGRGRTEAQRLTLTTIRSASYTRHQPGGVGDTDAIESAGACFAQSSWSTIAGMRRLDAA